ncbi:MAG: hypothetical protein KKB37_09470 [Alphaproteobacteria bacterium]|nr:hypothetical protein [Alphaproteobacteria bacterium]
MFRLVITVVTILILAGLLVWQEARWQMVADCEANGGQWDGASSRCRPMPRIYLERDLKRS